MAWIGLEGMRFYGYHGVYSAEQDLGTEYVIDVYVKTKIDKAAKEDNPEATLNYETIYQICQVEMEKPKPLPPQVQVTISAEEKARRQDMQPKKLIETVAMRIIRRLKMNFSQMEGLKVRVRKLNPPLGGRVDCALVEEEADFMKDCPRCQKNKFPCYGDENCWCKGYNLHPATLETLQQQFKKKCLCDACLKFYAGV